VLPELDASRFEMLDVIGTGGMGTVHRAVQRSVGRHVAIKVLAPEHAANASGLARFVREANIIARLTHPNIVQLIDFGKDKEGKLLLVMELLEGEPLRSVLRREQRLPIERAVYVTVQALNALRVAHNAGVIHRDLKPENIFIHRSGDDDHVKVLDFGVAKITQAEEVGHHTTQGSLIGTLRYMAPEQIAGEAPDARIDVYAMGMLLYEMLSGTLPYDTRDRFVLLRQIIAEEPVHLMVRAPDIPAPLADVVMRAIIKTPRDRFQSADDFRRALTPFLAADHARLQALADASSRPPTGTYPSGGEIRSGVVRSDHIRLQTGTGGTPWIPTGNPLPSQVSQPSQPIYPSQLGGPIVPVNTSSPMLVSAPPPRSSVVPWVIAGVMMLAALGAGALLFLNRPVPPPPAPVTRAPPRETTPATPVQQTLTQTPAAPTTPPPATSRTVVVDTSPPGAQVLTPEGQVLCASTPCGIPVPLNGQRNVVVKLDTLSLPTTLDGSSETASLNLAALRHSGSPRTTDPGQTPTPRRNEPRHGQGTSNDNSHDESPEVPVFLPHQ
jgi:serine/threonine-protein kinase